MAKKDRKQPARLSYFFSKGYRDLWNTIKESWARNFYTAKEKLAIARDRGIFSFGGGLNLVATIAIFTYGSFVSAITTFFHIAILLFFFVLVYLAFAALWIVDRLYIVINKIRNACPNPECQASFLIPVYECPKCGVKHTKLVPGKYGIFKRISYEIDNVGLIVIAITEIALKQTVKFSIQRCQAHPIKISHEQRRVKTHFLSQSLINLFVSSFLLELNLLTGETELSIVNVYAVENYE